MKKLVFLSVLFGALPLSSTAQDDLYFTPSKKEVKSSVENVTSDSYTYHVGSDRDVDEYNRRGKLSSYYEKVGQDSLGNDIIEFYPGDGHYTLRDSLAGKQYDYDDEFAYSRRMGRFDGFYGWYDPYFYGYWGGPWRYRWGWYDPWYAGYWEYGYYGWYAPCYGPWYSSWYYGYPYRHWGGRHHHGHYGHYGLGYRTSSRGSRFGRGYNFGNARDGGSRTAGIRSGNTARRGTVRNFGSNNGGTRSFTPSRAFGGGSRSIGGGSFGGSRSFGGGGGGGGGSRSFGGRR